MAVVGNDIAALDRTLETLGYQGDLKAPLGVGPNTRVVHFHRNELRRFCLDDLRKADRPLSARDLAVKVITFEGRDTRDRRLRAAWPVASERASSCSTHRASSPASEGLANCLCGCLLQKLNDRLFDRAFSKDFHRRSEQDMQP